MVFNQSFSIDDTFIGEGYKPYIIAEMSANHGNDINTAIEIIKKAKSAGADAIKIQTYTADTLTLKSEKPHFKAKGAWKGQYLYDLYLDASMPWKWTPKLQEVAKEVGITLFSSPFDVTSIEFLESCNMPAYKIASPEIVDLPLVRRIAQTGKPIIISTGNATIAQINDACVIMKEENVRDVVLLKCTSEYPAPAESINLSTIPHMKALFKCPVGLSDHSLGTAIPIASIAFGVSVIEKHFIISRDNKTADSFFSATPNELKEIVEGTLQVYKAIGCVDYPLVPCPSQRSLIAVKDISKNELFIENENIKSLRPGGGIESKEIANVEGRKATKKIPKGSLLSWDLVGGY